MSQVQVNAIEGAGQATRGRGSDDADDPQAASPIKPQRIHVVVRGDRLQAAAPWLGRRSQLPRTTAHCLSNRCSSASIVRTFSSLGRRLVKQAHDSAVVLGGQARKVADS